MRFAAAILFSSLTLCASAQSFQLHGFLTTRETYVKSQPSWVDGGVGRFDVGATDADDHRTVNTTFAQVGADWTPLHFLTLHADGVARNNNAAGVGRRAGVVQAYAEVFTDKLRVRAGLFFLPTSRENTDLFWTSPYTLTNSALNSWIAQEVRPIGVDVQYSPNFYITGGLTAFRGNDTMGTLIAEHGWTFGSRQTVYDEAIGLDATRSISPDLDHRNGYAERLRVQLPERAMLQAAHVDNRATLTTAPVHGQTPWATKFDVVGGTLGTTGPSTVSAEWMYGETSVGFPGGSYTMDFETTYVLLSRKIGPTRWTARIERFTTNSEVSRPDDPGREKGHAVTIAYLHDINAHVRAGLEWVRANGDRPGVAEYGFSPRTSGKTIAFELRYGF
jgi:hypothetical protein